MKLFAKMQDYVNPDHSALSWDQAIKALMEGKVAFSSMGDWAYGEFVKAHMKEKEDFGWVCHPYTDDSLLSSLTASHWPKVLRTNRRR